MSDDDIRAIAISGFAEALRRSPLVIALLLEAAIIGWLTWQTMEQSVRERERIAELTSQLVECHQKHR